MATKERQRYKLPEPGPVTLEQFLKGQREINGSFYEALDEILEVISAMRTTELGGKDPLARAKELVEGVPVIDPPGCVPPPPPPGGGGG